ncbi:MAG: DUF4124 domain-containing protein [Burkholderiales bacterium]|nr:DUF4124 domain-containing protein [Burkholderiales bacterium]
MKRHLAARLAVCTALLLLTGTGINATAQSAYRCDDNGKTTYSDKPCLAGKAVAPIQDTAQQQRASKDATDQLRRDNADLNKRLSDREKQEARERADARKTAGKLQPQAATKPSTAKARAGKAPKAVKAKKLSKAKGRQKPAGDAVSR